MTLQLIVTTAGRAAIAALGGTDAVVISEVGVSPTNTAVTEATTALPGEVKRIDTIAGAPVSADQIHLTIRDVTSDAYTLRAFALYLDDGTLFAVYSQAGVIMEKTAPITILLALDIALVDIAAADITFNDADFVLPPATETVQGVVELATNLEMTTGTDTQRAATPAGVRAAIDDRVPQATATTQGKVELATNAEMTTGTDTDRAATPAGVRAAIDDRVPQATATTQGKVELATNAEAIAGTDTDRAVTPAALAAKLADYAATPADLAAAVADLVAAMENNPHSTQLGEGRTFHRQWPESDYYKYPNGQLLPLPAYQDLADALDGDPFLATTIEEKAANPSMWYIVPGSHVHMPDMRGQFTRIWHDDLVDGVVRPALGKRKDNQNKEHDHDLPTELGGALNMQTLTHSDNSDEQLTGGVTGSEGGDEAVPDHTAIWYLIRVL
ncbi:hypothetical protein ABAC460_10200 [Asticcacaulis sp. AC460]|uniref:hypothetical protein n=1 Tax=Asticcacaulis sp. AC460 TaxID=1282360 RepID=UPI0003C3BA56|nr:hypothetical protein [Asticcacaulis sp. AC460]ESQ90121.1 hypothetical protein ABAC460_10200 [Asticcacaulis sp. AC460]